MPDDGTYIYRITHINNLCLCVQYGLCAPNYRPTSFSTGFTNIYNEQIQGDRGNKKIVNRPNHTIHDYVPFYFCPRSPMLYRIQRSNTAKPEDIIYFVSAPSNIKEAGKDFVFTDRNAWANAALWYDDFKDFNQLDWTAINAQMWSPNLSPPPPFDTKAKKQAEFLVYHNVEWDLLLGIGVYNKASKIKVGEILRSNGVNNNFKVIVTSNWYY